MMKQLIIRFFWVWLFSFGAFCLHANSIPPNIKFYTNDEEGNVKTYAQNNLFSPAALVEAQTILEEIEANTGMTVNLAVGEFYFTNRTGKQFAEEINQAGAKSTLISFDGKEEFIRIAKQQHQYWLPALLDKANQEFGGNTYNTITLGIAVYGSNYGDGLVSFEGAGAFYGVDNKDIISLIKSALKTCNNIGIKQEVSQNDHCLLEKLYLLELASNSDQNQELLIAIRVFPKATEIKNGSRQYFDNPQKGSLHLCLNQEDYMETYKNQAEEGIKNSYKKTGVIIPMGEMTVNFGCSVTNLSELHEIKAGYFRENAGKLTFYSLPDSYFEINWLLDGDEVVFDRPAGELISQGLLDRLSTAEKSILELKVKIKNYANSPTITTQLSLQRELLTIEKEDLVLFRVIIDGYTLPKLYESGYTFGFDRKQERRLDVGDDLQLELVNVIGSEVITYGMAEWSWTLVVNGQEVNSVLEREIVSINLTPNFSDVTLEIIAEKEDRRFKFNILLFPQKPIPDHSSNNIRDTSKVAFPGLSSIKNSSRRKSLEEKYKIWQIEALNSISPTDPLFNFIQDTTIGISVTWQSNIPGKNGNTTKTFDETPYYYGQLDLFNIVDEYDAVRSLPSTGYVIKNATLIYRINNEEKSALRFAAENKIITDLANKIISRLNETDPVKANIVKLDILDGLPVNQDDIYWPVNPSERNKFVDIKKNIMSIELNYSILGSNEYLMKQTFLHELRHAHFPFLCSLESLKWGIIREKITVYGYLLQDTSADNIKHGFCSAGPGHERFNTENPYACSGLMPTCK